MWVYTSDILDNFGGSVVSLINMLTIVFFAGLSNFGFDYFSVAYFYYFLAILQVFTITFLLVVVKETKGKTKEELLTLYKKIE